LHKGTLMNRNIQASDLIQYAASLLQHAGLEQEKSDVTAEILVEADLMGHTTHGLNLLAPYLNSIESGKMTLSGQPDVISERPAILTWDGNYLPGPWLTVKAFEEACERARVYGTGTVVIRRSHHIACLAAYLRAVTEQGLVGLLLCSDPSVGSVAPHGGTTPLYTPNPLAAGYPTSGDPVIMDVSMSTTTNGLSNRLYAAGERMPHAWMKTATGEITDDPGALFTDPPGSILPLGGVDSGHKGYALGLLVEMLTNSLSGFGRAEQPDSWGASVFVQVLDPECFGGIAAFKNESQWMADACRNSDVAAGDTLVRLPGQNGLKLRRQFLADGVQLHPGILDSLRPWADKYGIQQPG
jgi:LDH2 family malate/lactate/ureidoglycolate dehydrogenase